MSHRAQLARAKPSGLREPLSWEEFAAMLERVGLTPSAAGVSVATAAQLAGISDQAVRKAIMRGTLRATRLQPAGGLRSLTAVDLQSLREYIERNRRR